jgi:hypothetical protein
MTPSQDKAIERMRQIYHSIQNYGGREEQIHEGAAVIMLAQADVAEMLGDSQYALELRNGAKQLKGI